MNALCWLLCVAVNAVLLVALPRRLGGARIIKAGVIAIVAAPVVFVAAALALRGLGVHPSAQFAARFFAAFFTVIVMAMTNIANVAFRGMVDAIVGFHQRNNSANLDRFPISALIRHQDRLKTLASIVWRLGSGLMLYGVWFDTAVVK